MVVAVIAVRVVQVAVNEVVDVVTVWHGFMATTGAVNVAGFMAAALVFRCADVRVFGADFDDVLVHMIAVRVMQMAIVQVIDVITVFDCSMAAERAVLMLVVLMVGKIAVAHGFSPVREGLGGMFGVAQDVAEQDANVIVSQRIEDVLGVTATDDESGIEECLQACGNAAQLSLLVFNEFRYAHFPRGKQQ